MGYGEAYRLTTLLIADPSTRVGAALSSWSHPASREALVLMDLYDLQHQSKSKRKPKPYPRPWALPTRRSWGRGTSLTREALLATLQQHREETAHGE
jgi:hypothetical protein